MSGRFKPVSIQKRIAAIDKLIALDDDSLLRFAVMYDGVSREFRAEYRLTRRQFTGFIGVWDYLDIEGSISKTNMLNLFCIYGNAFKYGLPENLVQYFELTGKKKYILSTLGVSLRSKWVQSLRRVQSDHKEFHRLVDLQFNPGERAKRRERKRFFKLPEDQQITIVREFHALPGNTTEEKRIKSKAGSELFIKYDLLGTDIMSFIKKYGRTVTSVRDHPDIAPLFKPNT